MGTVCAPLQDLPCFSTGGGGSRVGTGREPSRDPLLHLLFLTKREREPGSQRSRELRPWIIPGAFPGPIEEGAPLDLSVVAAAVSGQNGP